MSTNDLSVEVSGEGDFTVYSDCAWRVVIVGVDASITVAIQGGRVELTYAGSRVEAVAL